MGIDEALVTRAALRYLEANIGKANPKKIGPLDPLFDILSDEDYDPKEVIGVIDRITPRIDASLVCIEKTTAMPIKAKSVGGPKVVSVMETQPSECTGHFKGNQLRLDNLDLDHVPSCIFDFDKPQVSAIYLNGNPIITNNGECMKAAKAYMSDHKADVYCR